MTGRVVDIGSFFNEQLRDVLVSVMSSDMERCEAGLGGHVGVVIILKI